MGKLSLTVIILTKNEELHIARAIDSVRPIASQIYVVDSYSTDKTVEICESLDVPVVKNKFINQAQQLEWAIENLSFKTDWIFRLDADEIIEADLVTEIQTKLPNLENVVKGVVLSRAHLFMGRRIRFGGRGSLKMLRIWRTGFGKVEQRWMDEHIYVDGHVINFKGGFLDCNLKNLNYFIEKHNQYASREALEQILISRGYKTEVLSDDNLATSLSVSIKRFVKNRIYDRLPFTLASLILFIWRYIFRLGFLDGREGLTYHFLQGYWYRFLVGAKLMEMQSAISNLSDAVSIKTKLSELSGIKVI